MALLDFLNKKKDSEKAKSLKDSKAKPEKKADKVALVKPKETSTLPEAKKYSKESDFSYEVVREPHISEKSTNLSQENKYVFKIYKNSNKLEIKKAIEGTYGVNVTAVNIIKIPKKKRRLGKTEGFRKSYSKAVITIKEGQRIEIY